MGIIPSPIVRRPRCTSMERRDIGRKIETTNVVPVIIESLVF
jgi:hypothetical protein